MRTRLPPPAPFRIIGHANYPGSPYLRRCPAGSWVFERPAPGRGAEDPPHTHPCAQHPPGVGRHGHRDRGAWRHLPRPGRRHRHYPQKPHPRAPGRGSAARQEIRGRHHRQPDHGVARYHHPQSPRSHPRASYLRRARHARRQVGRHRDLPRPAIRDALRRAGLRHHDAAGEARDGEGGRRARGDSAAPARAPHREDPGGGRRLRPEGPHHREGYPEVH